MRGSTQVKSCVTRALTENKSFRHMGGFTREKSRSHVLYVKRALPEMTPCRDMGRSTLKKSQLHVYVEINEDTREGPHWRKAIHVFSVWQGLYPITTASAGPWEDPHRWKAVHMRSVWRWSKPRQCRMDDLTPLGCRDLAHFGQSKPPQSWRHDRTHSLTVG